MTSQNELLRLALIDAGRALVIRVPPDGTQQLVAIEPNQHFYVLDFNGEEVRLIRSGTYIRWRSGTGSHKNISLGRSHILAEIVWDGGDPIDPAIHPATVFGLQLTDDRLVLAVASLEGIAWKEARYPAERRAHTPPTPT